MEPNPIVTPGTGTDPIGGSMTSPKVTTPTVPPPASATTAPSPLNVGTFATALSEMRGTLSQNNDLIEQKRKLITQLYDRPLTAEELNALSPSQQNSVKSNNRNLVDMELRLINDTIKGRSDTLDSSMKFLTDTFQKQQEETDAQYNKSVDIIKSFVDQYGSSAKDAIKSIYGQDFIDKLRMQGINLDSLGTVPKTIAERKLTTTDNGGFSVNIPQTSALAYQNNNPGNLKYANQDGASLGIQGFAKFNTPEEGFQALIDQIELDKSKGLTIEQFITKYAPPTENDTATYISQAEQTLGLTKDTKISDISSTDLANFVAQKESGTTTEAIPSDIQANAQAVLEGMPITMLAKRGTEYNAIIAEARRLAKAQGTTFDPTKAVLQYNAALAFVKSQNSSQNNRFRMLGVSVVNTINEVNDLADQVQQLGITSFNDLKNKVETGFYGNSEKGVLITRYLAAANTLKEEFANLANGGYAPTEAAWDLANSQINSNFGVKQMKGALLEVQRLINYRLNAQAELGPIGAGNFSLDTGGTPTPTGGSTTPTTAGNKPDINSFIK